MCVLYKNNSMTQKIWFKKKSPLHGSGLFAKTNIKKGQKVIQYIGDKVLKERVTKEQINKSVKQKKIKITAWSMFLN